MFDVNGLGEVTILRGGSILEGHQQPQLGERATWGSRQLGL